MEEQIDFGEMVRLIDEIKDKSLAKSRLELELKRAESEIFQEADTNLSLYSGGKPRSVSFIESAWKIPGLKGELIPKREELAKVTAELEDAKLRLDLHKIMIEVWRSNQANQRIGMG